MKNVQIEDDCVTTLAELAEELKKLYQWDRYEVADDHIKFWAKDGGREVAGQVDSTGFAVDQETGEDLDEFDVNWDEDFDGWSNRVWAWGEDGRLVMLHD